MTKLHKKSLSKLSEKVLTSPLQSPDRSRWTWPGEFRLASSSQKPPKWWWWTVAWQTNTTLKLRHVAGRFLVNSYNDPGQNVTVFLQVKDQNKLSCDPIHLKNRFGWIGDFLRLFGTHLKSSKSIRQNWPQNWGKPQCGLVCRDSTLGSKCWILMRNPTLAKWAMLDFREIFDIWQ